MASTKVNHQNTLLKERENLRGIFMSRGCPSENTVIVGEQNTVKKKINNDKKIKIELNCYHH